MQKAAYQFELTAAKRWTDVIVCASQKESEAFDGFVNPNRFEFIPNGIDILQWDERSSKTKLEARRELGLPESARIAVAVGRVTRQKGPDLMTEVWTKVRQTYPDCFLEWVGDGNLRDELIQHTSGDDTIRFCGPTHNTKRYYEAADFMVMPSRWEGHSLALLEAMATSCPVIAFDVEGMSKTISDGTGFVVPAEDCDAFADVLIQNFRSSDQQIEHLGEMARQRIMDHFTLEKACKKVREIYSDLDQSVKLADSQLGSEKIHAVN